MGVGINSVHFGSLSPSPHVMYTAAALLVEVAMEKGGEGRGEREGGVFRGHAYPIFHRAVSLLILSLVISFVH